MKLTQIIERRGEEFRFRANFTISARIQIECVNFRAKNNPGNGRVSCKSMKVEFLMELKYEGPAHDCFPEPCSFSKLF